MINIFPKKVLAIDISDSSIEILQMSQIFGKIKVTFLSRCELENGIIEKGKILKKKQLVLKLKEYCPEGIVNDKVALALPDTIVFNHIFRFSGDKNISTQDILSEAKKVLPVDIDNSYWDFDSQIIGSDKIVFFAAAHKKDIDEYKSVFDEINLVPKIFDLNSLSALRAINLEQEGTLIIDLGGRFGVISIFDGGLMQLTSIVNFGGENFTEKLSEKLKISHEQAEFFKITVGFNPDMESGRVFLILQEILQPLIEEMRNAINSYESKNEKKVKKIILSGGSGLMPKLDEYIFSNFSIHTEIGRPHLSDLILKYLKANNAQIGIDTIFFAPTLGLATKYLGIKTHFNIGVNLLK